MSDTITSPTPAQSTLPNKSQPDWIVERDRFDASKPYAVVATFRNFNKVKNRYATEQQAKRRARDLNRTPKD